MSRRDYHSSGGWSPSDASCAIRRAIALHEAAQPWSTWYGRVPFKSNPADAASRLKLAEVVE
eukprot:4601915-Amphidinium_carterae.1